MITWQRCRPVLVLLAVLLAVAGCTTSGSTRPTSSAVGSSSLSGGPSSDVPSSDAPSSDAPSSDAPSSDTPSSDTPSSDAPSTTDRPRPVHRHLRPARSQLTRHGMWWAVDSVAPIDAATLANIRDFYVGSPKPVAWGRYVSGHFGIDRAEIAFAKAHGIGIYFIVPDDNCSACSGGDACGNDITVTQARTDAQESVREARRLKLPRGVTLYKDIEEVGSCHGELSAEYLRAWFDYVRKTRFVPAFYGNSNEQSYDFPRAYCAAVKQDARFAREVTLAQDEPEPQLGAPRRTIGPKNAPRFAPYHPQCTSLSKVRIWQYGESIDNANSTDVDQIVPGTHGILAPDGHVT